MNVKKVAVIFWSGTGNTEKMAEALAKGASSKEAKVTLLPVDTADLSHVEEADALAFGCPSMGGEVLEETLMEPFIASLTKELIEEKPLVLFGSYDWGDGEWMRDWEERMESLGAKLLGEGLIVQNAPNEDSLRLCYELGEKLLG